MTEVLHERQFTLADFSDHVLQSRFSSVSPTGWEGISSRYLHGEVNEFLNQHGNGAALLYPTAAYDQLGIDLHSAPVELRYHMADELGDLTWFTFDAAQKHRLKVATCVEKSLATRGVQDVVTTFDDIQRLGQQYAGNIRIATKGSMMLGEAYMSDLESNPLLMFIRSYSRLCRSLKSESPTGYPLSTTYLEPVVDTETAIGDCLLAVGFIAHKRLLIAMQDIARFNKAKLGHRQIHGKENDLQFADWYQSRIAENS